MVTGSLRRGISAILLGNLAYTAGQFGMLVAVARFADVEEVGRYALALAITAPIFTFAGLKLRQVQVTDAAGVNRSGDFFSLRAATSVVAFVASVLVAVAAGLPRETVLAVTAVAAFKAVEAQVDVLYGALQRRELMGPIARSQIVRGVVGMIVFGVAIALTERVSVAAAALAVFTLLPLVTNTLAVRRAGIDSGWSTDGEVLGRLAWLALPLGISVSVGSLVANVPRYLLQAFEGAAGLGIFAALAYLLVATSTIATAMSEGASARLANQYAAGDATGFTYVLHRLVLAGIGLGLAGTLGAALLGRPALWLLFGEDYADEWLVLVVLMVAATLQYAALFLGTAVNAMRLFKVQVPINVAGLVVTTAACLVLIPTWGLMGAAWAMVAAQAAQGVMYAWLYLRRVRPALTPGPSRSG